MTNKMKFFRFLSYIFIGLCFIICLYTRFWKTHLIFAILSFIICFIMFYLITYLGWRCPICGKPLPRNATIHLEKCKYCETIFNKKEETKSKSENQIIEEYDNMMARYTINSVVSFFVIITSAIVNFFKYGMYIWLFILSIVVLYNINFYFKKKRCPNCNHLFFKYDLNLKKCPYCGVKLRNY